MDELQDWARQKAVEYICHSSGEPVTPYEHGAVKEMTAFLLRAMSDFDYKEKEIALLEELQNLVQSVPLSELGLRVAVGMIVAFRMHELTGVPLVSSEDMEWAITKGKELGLIESIKEE